MIKYPDLLTRAEAAEYLRISTRTLDTMIAQKKVTFMRLGGRSGKILFAQKDLDAYLASRRVEAVNPRTVPYEGTYRRRRSAG